MLFCLLLRRGLYHRVTRSLEGKESTDGCFSTYSFHRFTCSTALEYLLPSVYYRLSMHVRWVPSLQAVQGFQYVFVLFLVLRGYQ